MPSKIESDYFMKMDVTPYLGEWIAIHRRAVIAHARSFRDVYSAVCEIMNPSAVLFDPIPDSDYLIV